MKYKRFNKTVKRARLTDLADDFFRYNDNDVSDYIAYQLAERNAIVADRDSYYKNRNEINSDIDLRDKTYILP